MAGDEAGHFLGRAKRGTSRLAAWVGGLVKPGLASCGRAWQFSGKGMREGFGIIAGVGEEGDRQEEWTLVSYSHQKLAPQSHAFSEHLV